jgi:hypothetical protein
MDLIPYLYCGDIVLEALWEDEVVTLHSVGHEASGVVKLQQPLVHPSGAAAFSVTQTPHGVGFSVVQRADADVGHPFGQPQKVSLEAPGGVQFAVEQEVHSATPLELGHGSGLPAAH